MGSTKYFSESEIEILSFNTIPNQNSTCHIHKLDVQLKNAFS